MLVGVLAAADVRSISGRDPRAAESQQENREDDEQSAHGYSVLPAEQAPVHAKPRSSPNPSQRGV
jgi:hypothetical protein